MQKSLRSNPVCQVLGKIAACAVFVFPLMQSGNLQAGKLVFEQDFTKTSSMDELNANWETIHGNGLAEGMPGWGSGELQFFTANSLRIKV